MAGQRKPISSEEEGARDEIYRRVFSLATDTIGNRFACKKKSSRKTKRSKGTCPRAVNDERSSSLSFLIFFIFLLSSFFLSFFLFFNSRDSARHTSRRRKRSERESRSMFYHQVFRIPSLPFGYSPVGSFGEIDRKLFDTFALWRIYVGQLHTE